MESKRDVAYGLIKGQICGFSSWRLGVGEGQIVLNHLTYVCGTSPDQADTEAGWRAGSQGPNRRVTWIERSLAGVSIVQMHE